MQFTWACVCWYVPLVQTCPVPTGNIAFAVAEPVGVVVGLLFRFSMY